MEPLLLVDSSNNRIIREPSTGLDFQKMFKYVTEKYVVPLPIAVALDKLALNKLGSRGAKPTYVQIASRTAEKYWSSSNLNPITQVSVCNAFRLLE